MWLPPALLLLSLPGCFSLQGPGSVRGRERGSLTVQCRYNPLWETYVKYWCRGAHWDSCNILVRTTGSEQEVKKGNVSIRDHQKDRVFTVTMEALTRGDAGTYWCGIEKTGLDPWAQVEVTVGPEGTLMNTQFEIIGNNHTEVPGSYSRTHYMLLAFVKVPILLLVVGAVLWLKPPRQALSSGAGSPSLPPCPLDV
ncbi:CMRF35-like molecule 7 [Talpa occidentalis]|uniref:CMRF35-like molecule 7 n=1 Tax=Talpa occidentalis TaxID=50954 RepID=UPI0018901B64|nr:CMRF35-like molecule 7 [Talpa occidentalis]